LWQTGYPYTDMTSLILSGLLVLGLPLVLLLMFKASAGMMFFAACAGLVLLHSLDPAVVSTAAAVVPGEGDEAYVRWRSWRRLLFAALMFRGTVHGMTSLLLHAFVVLLLALMLWVTLPSATGLSWMLENSRESVWRTVNDFRSLIVAAGFSLSMVVILTNKGRSKH